MISWDWIVVAHCHYFSHNQSQSVGVANVDPNYAHVISILEHKSTYPGRQELLLSRREDGRGGTEG